MIFAHSPAAPSSTGIVYSFVIPFFNEVEGAAELVEELREVTARLDGVCEVLLIDDGSNDGTAGVLEKLAADWPDVRVFRFAKNQGQAAALYFGIARARGRVVVTLDGDGQNDPADIPKLLARLDNADMAVGVRARRRDSWLRRRMSRLANGVRSRLLGDGVSDTGCGLKAFRRETAEAFVPIRTLYSFMPALAKASGFRLVEETVNHRPRRKGNSKYGLGVMLWRPLLDMIGVWWLTRRRCALPGLVTLLSPLE